MTLLINKFKAMGRTHKIITIELITLGFIAIALIAVDNIRHSPSKKVVPQASLESLQAPKAIAQNPQKVKSGKEKTQNNSKISKTKAQKRVVASANPRAKKQPKAKSGKNSQGNSKSEYKKRS